MLHLTEVLDLIATEAPLFHWLPLTRERSSTLLIKIAATSIIGEVKPGEDEDTVDQLQLFCLPDSTLFTA